MNFLYREERYQQVRSGSLDRSVPLKFFQDDTYHTVLEKLKDKFFPDGKNEKGTIKDFDMELGTAKKKIEKDAFTVGHYCRTAKGGRARIYLLTKRKQLKLIGTSSSSDESDDFLLPPPWRTARTKVISSPGNSESQLSFDDLLSIEPMDITEMDSARNAQVTASNDSSSSTVATTTQAMSSPTQVSTDGNFREAGTPTVQLNIGNSRNCIVCWDNEPNAFFFPCGHTCCIICARFLQSNNGKCPTCRGAVTDVKTIYF